MRKLLVTLGPIALAACGSGDGEFAQEHSEETVGTSQDSILNGIDASPGDNRGAVAVYGGRSSKPCSGTLFRGRWVLTARHCLATDDTETTLYPPDTFSVHWSVTAGATRPADAVRVLQITEFGDEDFAMLKLLGPITAIPSMGLWDGNFDRLDPDIDAGNTYARVLGYGANALGSGYGTLRWADLVVTHLDWNLLWYGSVGGRILLPGDSGGPGLLHNFIGNGQPYGLAVVNTSSSLSDFAYGVFLPPFRNAIKRAAFVPGDMHADGAADVVLTGPSNWTTIPIARLSNGTFTVTNNWVADFPTLAATAGAHKVAGDFNADGVTDLALVGGSGWNYIYLALSSGNGNFVSIKYVAPDFVRWATSSGVKAVPGDFNADGWEDIALTGPIGWTTLPIAFSGPVPFTVVNNSLASFPAWAATANVKAVPGDFNGDGRTDIALVGGSGWSTIPIAFAMPGGSFTVTNFSAGNFPPQSREAGAKVVSGDFNADGLDDIALTGVRGWFGMRVAFSRGDGKFDYVIQNMTQAADWSIWSSSAGVQVISGDYNGDKIDDIALTGPIGWQTIPIAFSSGSDFSVQNIWLSPVDFGAWASSAGAVALSSRKAN